MLTDWIGQKKSGAPFTVARAYPIWRQQCFSRAAKVQERRISSLLPRYWMRLLPICSTRQGQVHSLE